MRHTQSTFGIDVRLRCIAAKQLGLVTVAQAQAAGIDKHALARRRDIGTLVPVFRHVMRLEPFPSTPAQRALAAALAVPGSIVAATSAAVVHQLPVSARATTPEPDVPLAAPDEVLSVTTSRRLDNPGITVVRQTTQLPSTRWLTTRLATPTATLLLLPRFVDDWTLERCLDHVLAHRLSTAAKIRQQIDRTAMRAVHKRSLLLGLLADRSAGIGHRSGMEQAVARWLRNAGLKGWTRNLRVRVHNNTHVEVDFGWPPLRLAREVSPFFTHGSRQKQERDAERRRLLVAAGWRVVEATDPDLANERAFERTAVTLRMLGAT